jgi:hypothetical protein
MGNSVLAVQQPRAACLGAAGVGVALSVRSVWRVKRPARQPRLMQHGTSQHTGHCGTSSFAFAACACCYPGAGCRHHAARLVLNMVHAWQCRGRVWRACSGRSRYTPPSVSECLPPPDCITHQSAPASSIICVGGLPDRGGSGVCSVLRYSPSIRREGYVAEGMRRGSWALAHWAVGTGWCTTPPHLHTSTPDD